MASRDSIMKKPKDAKSALRRLLEYLGEYKYYNKLHIQQAITFMPRKPLYNKETVW